MLPIGYEDIKTIIDKNLYFIDKSLLVEEVLNQGRSDDSAHKTQKVRKDAESVCNPQVLLKTSGQKREKNQITHISF